MEILKWYSIIVFMVCYLICLFVLLADDEKEERRKAFVNMLLYLPILIYLIFG